MEEEIINEFTSIKGVGESRAKALYEAGYTSIGDLNDATAEELSRVRGITDQLAERIKNEVSQIYEDIEAGKAVEESTQEVVGTEKVEVEAEKEFEEQAGEGDEEDKEIEAVPTAELELDPESQRLRSKKPKSQILSRLICTRKRDLKITGGGPRDCITRNGAISLERVEWPG